MNETLILLQQNRAENVWGQRKMKEVPSGTGTIVNEEIPQDEKQPSRQYNNLAESLNDESSNEQEDDVTAYKMCKTPWIELTEKCGDWVQWNICNEYICPNCYDKRDISANDDFFCSIFIRS